MQRRRAERVGDQDHGDRPRLGGGDEAADRVQLALVTRSDGEGDEFRRCVRAGERLQRRARAEGAPALADLGLQILDQEVEALHVAGDGDGERGGRGPRLGDCAHQHRRSPSPPAPRPQPPTSRWMGENGGGITAEKPSFRDGCASGRWIIPPSGTP